MTWLRIAVAALSVTWVAACNPAHNVSRSVGARCDSNDQCENRCLQAADYPDGFCTLPCDSTDDCPPKTVCADIEGGICLFDCVADEQCEFLGAGWVCEQRDSKPDGEVMICIGD